MGSGSELQRYNDTDKAQVSIEFYGINEDRNPQMLELDSADKNLLTRFGDVESVAVPKPYCALCR
jgi:hypothetical protein